jgi:hypothetical protein
MNNNPVGAPTHKQRNRPFCQAQAKQPPFAIDSVEPVHTGNLLAFVSVRIGRGPQAFTVHKWRLIASDAGPWLQAPQEIWTDLASGTRRYRNMCTFPKEWRQPLTQAALVALAALAELAAREAKEAALPVHPAPAAVSVAGQAGGEQ